MSERERQIVAVETLCGAVFSPDLRAFLLAPKAPLSRRGCPTEHDLTLMGLLPFSRMRPISDRRGHRMLGLLDNAEQLEVGALIEDGRIGPGLAIYDANDESGDGISLGFDDLVALEAHVRDVRERRKFDKTGPLAVLHALLNDPLPHQTSRHIGALCRKGWLRDWQNGNVTTEGVAALEAAGFAVSEEQRRSCAVLPFSVVAFRFVANVRPMVGDEISLFLDGSGRISVRSGDRTVGAVWDNLMLRRTLADGHATGGRVAAVWERYAEAALRLLPPTL